MDIAPEIVARHWEAAAAEQLARDLEREGYKVSQREQIGDQTASVVARRGTEVVVFGVKAPPWGEQQAQRLVQLRNHVVGQLGGRFELVVVTPPREIAAEVAGLRSILFDQLNASLPGEVQSLAPRVELFALSSMEIGSIKVHPPVIQVEGDAVMTVMLWPDKDGDNTKDGESFPLSFRVNLDTRGELLSVEHLEVDTSAWHGGDQASDETESKAETNAVGPKSDTAVMHSLT